MSLRLRAAVRVHSQPRPRSRALVRLKCSRFALRACLFVALRAGLSLALRACRCPRLLLALALLDRVGVGELGLVRVRRVAHRLDSVVVQVEAKGDAPAAESTRKRDGGGASACARACQVSARARACACARACKRA
eukprot:6177788-Pleurochrysis_carterae.AAC.1